MIDKPQPLSVVVAVDGSAHAQAALRWIAGLHAARVPLDCVLLDAQRPLLAGEVGAISPASHVLAERDRAAGEILAEAAAVLRAAGVACETERRLEDPPKAIADCAAARAREAIVLGRRGRGPVSAALLGSVSAETVRSAPVPVVVVNADVPDPLPHPLRILIAADNSDAAARAAAMAARLAGLGAEGELHAVHVQPTLAVASALFGPRERLLEHWSGAGQEEALAKVRAALDRAGRPLIIHAVQDPDPGAAILREAERLGCGLIAMGTRGRGAVAGLLLGSVARQVLAQARVPVLLAR